MSIIDISKSASDYTGSPNTTHTDLHLFTQFFIHTDQTRYQEIKECLRQNVQNPHITTIHLLNERIYTIKELGLSSPKIIQTNIGHRLKYQDVFKHIADTAIKGYHILANSDILFDGSIRKLEQTDIHIKKKMLAQLRYEYNSQNIQLSKLFGPRFDSQDTWIFHSNFPITGSQLKMFNFQFGQPGCDNKILYLMKVLGYEIYNDPLFIKTYHNHSAVARDYTNKDIVKYPWAVSCPYNVGPILSESLGIDLNRDYEQTRGFQDMRFEDNFKIHDYITQKLANSQNFIIPRISKIENNMAVFAKIAREEPSIPQNIMDYFKTGINEMKTFSGIKLSSIESIMKYSDMYLKAFENAEMYCGWESQGIYIQHIPQSHAYMKIAFQSKQIVWGYALDIFHYIYTLPWTMALRGKRILIISPFESRIVAKIPVLTKIYQKEGPDAAQPVDLFPGCEIVTIEPPQTQGDTQSLEFDQELSRFCERLDVIKDTYDIALVSASGYENLICNHIYESGKSAICVGDVLQMYFGILGNQWLQERPDIVRMFMNEHW